MVTPYVVYMNDFPDIQRVYQNIETLTIYFFLGTDYADFPNLLYSFSVEIHVIRA